MWFTSFFSMFIRCSTMEPVPSDWIFRFWRSKGFMGFVSLRPDLPNLMKSRAPQVDALRAWANLVDRCLGHSNPTCNLKKDTCFNFFVKLNWYTDIYSIEMFCSSCGYRLYCPWKEGVMARGFTFLYSIPPKFFSAREPPLMALLYTKHHIAVFTTAVHRGC